MCRVFVGFTLTVVNDFRRFLSQFSAKCHAIINLQALVSKKYPEKFIEKIVCIYIWPL